MRNKVLTRVMGSLAAAAALFAFVPVTQAAEYKIDPAHSFVQFRIQHLGYSWLMGRFNRVLGEFTYDAANPGVSTIAVEIDTTTVDTNHAERDKDLRSENFLHVRRYPRATFKSTKYMGNGKAGTLQGVLTLHGVSKPISINVEKIGEGKDPWGGYRAGFFGKTTLTRRDFGMEYNLGPASETMKLELTVEGIRK